MPLVLDGFESGSLQNWRAFQSSNSKAVANLVSPGQLSTYAMKIDYSIGEWGWAGMERLFTTAQNWKSYQAIGFSFYGTNSGSIIRFEILDNRALGNDGDTAERFEYKFRDDFNGWKAFNLPWNAFVRRTDWQPQGAPNDGFNLTAIWGFNFSPISGQGSFQVDNIKLSSP